MPTVVKQLADCSKEDLDAFETLVMSGGKVKPGLRGRMESNAERLAFHYAPDGSVVGVAALKRPYSTYKAKVFQRAKTDQNPADYELELGWIAVAPPAQGQGLSRALAEAVLPFAEGKHVYATTEECNERMRRTNARLGFVESGQPYLDDDGEDRLLLYIRRSE